MLLRMPSNWLKIPKSVIVTDFPLSSFKYLMYLAEMCCDFPKLVSGQWTFLVEILSFCCGRGGCRWHFLAPLTCVIPHADSCTIICTVRQRHRYELRFLAFSQQISRLFCKLVQCSMTPLVEGIAVSFVCNFLRRL